MIVSLQFFIQVLLCCASHTLENMLVKEHVLGEAGVGKTGDQGSKVRYTGYKIVLKKFMFLKL